jgi:glycosyltransferase involved in cell wall biosynthesis
VQRIVTELVHRRHEVFVISTVPLRDRRERESALCAPSSERVYRFFPPNLYHVLYDYQYPYPVRALWHLVDLWSSAPVARVEKILRERKPDIVLTHNLKGIGMRVPDAMRRLRIPFIHTVHDIQLSVPSGLMLLGRPLPWLEGVTRTWYERQTRRAVGRPNLVISPSCFLADFYQRRGFFADTVLRVLPNPAPAFTPSERPPRSHEGVRLLFAGQLAPHKGIMDIMDAVDRAEAPAELHVAGEGVCADAVRERAARDPRVIFHGLLSHEHLQHLFVTMDATVVPSVCLENSPTIIYESLQSGVPVLAADIGGVGELIQHGKNGILIPPGDVDAWTQAIDAFAQEASSYWSQTEKIRASVAPFSLSHYVDTLESWGRESVVGSREYAS